MLCLSVVILRSIIAVCFPKIRKTASISWQRHWEERHSYMRIMLNKVCNLVVQMAFLLLQIVCFFVKWCSENWDVESLLGRVLFILILLTSTDFQSL